MLVSTAGMPVHDQIIDVTDRAGAERSAVHRKHKIEIGGARRIMGHRTGKAAGQLALVAHALDALLRRLPMTNTLLSQPTGQLPGSMPGLAGIAVFLLGLQQSPYGSIPYRALQTEDRAGVTFLSNARQSRLCGASRCRLRASLGFVYMCAHGAAFCF
jgi:hypothetical protein